MAVCDWCGQDMVTCRAAIGSSWLARLELRLGLSRARLDRISSVRCASDDREELGAYPRLWSPELEDVAARVGAGEVTVVFGMRRGRIQGPRDMSRAVVASVIPGKVPGSGAVKVQSGSLGLLRRARFPSLC